MSKSAGDVIEALVNLLRLVPELLASGMFATFSAETSLRLPLLLVGVEGLVSKAFDDWGDFLLKSSSALDCRMGEPFRTLLNSSDVCREIPRP